jgi:hypothetical protein
MDRNLTARRPSCLICVNGDSGLRHTRCDVYGPIWDETAGARDCPCYADDPDKT